MGQFYGSSYQLNCPSKLAIPGYRFILEIAKGPDTLISNEKSLQDTQTSIYSIYASCHTILTSSLQFSSCCFIGSEDKSVRVWSAGSGVVVVHFTEHSDVISNVLITSDNKRILSADFSNYMKLWKAESGEVRRRQSELTITCNSLHFVCLRPLKMVSSLYAVIGTRPNVQSMVAKRGLTYRANVHTSMWKSHSKHSTAEFQSIKQKYQRAGLRPETGDYVFVVYYSTNKNWTKGQFIHNAKVTEVENIPTCLNHSKHI